VVVHEPGQVEALVLAQQEGENVRLPELVGLRALESPGLVLARARRRRLGHQALLMQRATHPGLRDTEPIVTPEFVPDAPSAPVGVLATRSHHRLALGCGSRRARAAARIRRQRHQRIDATTVIPPHPLLDGVRRHAEHALEVAERRIAFDRFADHAPSQLHGIYAAPAPKGLRRALLPRPPLRP